MKKLRRIFIETFVILLIQLLNKTQAGCSWGTNNCAVSCTSSFISYAVGSETPQQVMEILEQSWKEHASCHADGIILTLDGMNYPNFNVEANWFTANVRVKELLFWAANIGIEANAFNSTALRSVTKLTFPSTGINPIRTGIFNGLESLEELHLQWASGLGIIQDGVLNPVSGTLKRFSLAASSSSFSQIRIDGFTGFETLTALTNVKFDYTLTSTITRNSFLGLRYVETLDLSNCQIETLGAGAFDPIGNSVRDLNLRNNRIKTLPDGIFNNILLTNIATIRLEGNNRWVCDCDLMPFKLALLENENFEGSVKCYEPQYLRNGEIVITTFCDEYVPTTTTTTTTTSTTTTSTTTTTTPSTPTDQSTSDTPTEPSVPEEEFSQICYESVDTAATKNVTIKTPKSGLRINENVDGHPVLEMDMDAENSVLIWFSQLDRETYRIAGDDISCVISSGRSIPITDDLKEDVAYTFCLMDSIEKTVSPLDCISYTKARAGEQPWLYNADKGLIISMAALACFVSWLIGWAVGFFTLNQILKKKNREQNLKGTSCINDVLKEAFQSNSIMRQQNRMSMTTISSGNTKRATNYTVDYYLENAPPLPARPHSMHPFEEPIYAVVRN